MVTLALLIPFIKNIIVGIFIQNSSTDMIKT